MVKTLSLVFRDTGTYKCVWTHTKGQLTHLLKMPLEACICSKNSRAKFLLNAIDNR